MPCKLRIPLAINIFNPKMFRMGRISKRGNKAKLILVKILSLCLVVLFSPLVLPATASKIDSLESIRAKGNVGVDLLAYLEELRKKYETEKKEQAIVTLEKGKKAGRFRRHTFTGVALSVIGFRSSFIHQPEITTRRNKELLKREQEIDQMKIRFLANIIHEFRTPLTLILGPIDMILAKAASPRLLKHLDIMKANAARLLDLINQMLELPKLESGAYKLSATPANIVPVVKGRCCYLISDRSIKNLLLEDVFLLL